MDYAALPPEINSARIIAGPGSAPLIAAAMSWTSLGAELNAAVAGWQSVTVTLLGAWHGPSSIAMLGAASSHIAWLTQAAIHAELTAAQAQMAAGAYEMARAAMVPLPMVTANRLQLMVLIATNLLGQNTAAIAANEAQYAAMWAQDVAVMGAYHGASQAAVSALPILAPSTTVTNPALAASGAAAAPVNQASSIGSILSGLFGSGGVLDNSTTSGQLIQTAISSGFPLNLIQLFMMASISQSVGEIANNGITLRAPIIPAMPIPGMSALPGAPNMSMRVGVGRELGGLIRVPPSWTQAAMPNAPEPLPTVRPLAAGQGFIPAPIPTALAARSAAAKKEESPPLAARMRFVTRPPSGG